jgi:hypothetical protein
MAETLLPQVPRERPAYSVLMPLAPWEPPEQVAAALASLAGQSLGCGQLVVSADGILPPALEAVLAASGLPVERLTGPGGEGVGPVLQRGLLACRQELVVRADADDLCLPERCALQVAAMLARPELAALSAPILEFIEDPRHPCSTRSVPVGAAALRRRSRWRNPLNHPAVILRRQMVLAVGGYRDCPGFEDYDLWLRLLQAGALLDNLAQPLVLARVGAHHLARRRGLAYAAKEWRFLRACGSQGSFPWPRVLLLALLRLPVRLVPAGWQRHFTKNWLRVRPSGITGTESGGSQLRCDGGGRLDAPFRP